MSNSYYFGFAIGFLIAFVVLLFLLLLRRKKEKCDFDERQILARGVAYKFGMLTAGSYMIIAGLVCSIFELSISVFDVLLIGFWLTFVIFAVVSIIKDAFFQPNNKGKISYIILCSFISVMNLGICIYDGIDKLHIPNLITGISCVVILIAFIFKFIIDKKSQED